jgi:hypothetical protein
MEVLLLPDLTLSCTPEQPCVQALPEIALRIKREPTIVGKRTVNKGVYDPGKVRDPELERSVSLQYPMDFPQSPCCVEPRNVFENMAREHQLVRSTWDGKLFISPSCLVSTSGHSIQRVPLGPQGTS